MLLFLIAFAIIVLGPLCKWEDHYFVGIQSYSDESTSC
jgi:hypothetical protein